MQTNEWLKEPQFDNGEITSFERGKQGLRE